MSLTWKVAAEEWEFEQIHQLNYATFVEEIPQHAPNGSRFLVDRFHDENTYLICLDGREVVGMLALRGNRPFSLDAKLPNLDSYLPPGHSACEIRLLAVRPGRRTGTIFWGLLRQLPDRLRSMGCDLAVISGTVRQAKLYANLGFVPFGPLVGAPEALYQPMYLTVQGFRKRAARLGTRTSPDPPVSSRSFLPGPVEVAPVVMEAFLAPPISHRSPAFTRQMQGVRRRLAALTGAEHCSILLGSGTLANDVAAGQLSLLDAPGLVLCNGEFGERLADHARRARLRFRTLHKQWGEPFYPGELQDLLERQPETAWLWVVHCETSTGVLNDLKMFEEICAPASVRLCVDCVSSLGTTPLDLSGVYLATAASGKGLGSLPGLSLVFHNHHVEPAPHQLPRYLDLGLYAACDGTPFTHSSNLLAALAAALRRFEEDGAFREQAELAARLRARLRGMGFSIVAPEAHAAPGVVTLALPPELSAETVGTGMERLGSLLSYRSAYLRRRNWLQISLMGECSLPVLEPMLGHLEMLAGRNDGPPSAGGAGEVKGSLARLA